jgi:hypothetical protein
MSENLSVSPDIQFEGNMYLFQQPELLTNDKHGGLGLSRVDRPFDFAKAVKAIPIAVTELKAVQRHYPIVFSDLENPALLAVLGIDDENLFVDSNGNWESDLYIPAYIRCHPFALATNENGQSVGVIDRAAPGVSEQPELPFFDGESVTAEIQARLNVCAEFTAQRQHTVAFCKRLKAIGMLAGQQVSHKAAPDEDEKVLATFVSVEPGLLQAIDKDTLQELHTNGWLSAIYAQIFSLENWHSLIARHGRRENKETDPSDESLA